MDDLSFRLAFILFGGAFGVGLAMVVCGTPGRAPRAGRVLLRLLTVAAVLPWMFTLFEGSGRLSAIVQSALILAGLWCAMSALLAAGSRSCVRWSMAAAMSCAGVLVARGVLATAATLAITHVLLLWTLWRWSGQEPADRPEQPELPADSRQLARRRPELVAACFAGGLFLSALLVAWPMRSPAALETAKRVAPVPAATVIQSLLGRYALPTLGLSVLVFAAVTMAGSWQASTGEGEEVEQNPR